jgi:hypothetical protein
MTVTISRLYDNHDDAQHAVRRLESAGVPHSDISIVANNSDSWFNTDKKVDRDHDGVDDRAKGAGKGAGIGAGVGGTAGLVAGLGLLAIPGLGPVVAAGWLAATAVGAAAGAATGGNCRSAHAGRRFGTGRSLLCRGRPSWRHAGVGTSGRCGPVPPRCDIERVCHQPARPECCLAKGRMESFDPASKPYGAEDNSQGAAAVRWRVPLGNIERPAPAGLFFRHSRIKPTSPWGTLEGTSWTSMPSIQMVHGW